MAAPAEPQKVIAVHIDALRLRLASARDLPGLLAATWDAFDFLQTAARGCADPGSGTYAGFMFASASAAEAREAVGFAPSMPAGAPVPGGGDESLTDDIPVTPGMLAELAGMLSSRLNEAVRQATDPDDKNALARAAAGAEQIRGLLGGDP